MTDFVDKGYAFLDSIDPGFAQDLWDDVDKEEYHRLLCEERDNHSEPLTIPRTQAFRNFLGEVYKVRNSPVP